MPNPPFPPLFVDSGELELDLPLNLAIVIGYLYDLSGYLADGEPDGGWSTSGVTERKTLTVGDTLAETQDTLGTLMELLAQKGILAP